jgi:GH25 family lysozyme M1 (1,4-beta-N-acetylmuramidase)
MQHLEQCFMPKSKRFCQYSGAGVIEGIVDAASLSMVLLGIFYIEGKETDDFIEG